MAEEEEFPIPSDMVDIATITENQKALSKSASTFYQEDPFAPNFASASNQEDPFAPIKDTLGFTASDTPPKTTLIPMMIEKEDKIERLPLLKTNSLIVVLLPKGKKKKKKAKAKKKSTITDGEFGIAVIMI